MVKAWTTVQYEYYWPFHHCRSLCHQTGPEHINVQVTIIYLDSRLRSFGRVIDASLICHISGDMLLRTLLRMLLRILCLIILLVSFQAQAEPASMEDYTTCAVYHRMLASAFKRDRDLQIMAELEIEKMNSFIASAKTAGTEEYGQDLVEQLFQDEWNAALSYLTDQINRSYQNVSRLKPRYKTRCAALEQ